MAEKVDAIDFVIDVLREHERNLDKLINRLEQLIGKLRVIEEGGAPHLTDIHSYTGEPPVKEEEESFSNVVGETLLKLPKGYNFEIAKIVHNAYVRIFWKEPNSCQKAED